MSIPNNSPTNPAAAAAAARLEQLKQQLNLTPSAMSLQAPKDMAAERAAAEFDIEALARFWAGGDVRYEAMKRAYAFVENDPDLVLQPPRNFHELTRPDAREFAVRQLNRFARVMVDPAIKNDKEFADALLNVMNIYSESLSMRLFVHVSLFRNVLCLLGTNEQRDQWVDDVDNFRIIGCFAMTELGHSSALRTIETRATYDQATDEFVISSPSITSTKWWIGMAGQTATHTVVIAQTYIGGKHYGHNWFIVQLRDRKTGELMPNVMAGDIGHKVGRPGLDNGWIQFQNTRIPRTNMLMRWATLDRNGTYTPAPSPAVMYATLIPERISSIGNMVRMLTQALVIATRYGVVRRQGHQNQQIMDYQSHYGKLVPAIAFIYMIRSATSTIEDQYKILIGGGSMDPTVYLNHMSDMHGTSACLKSLEGWYGSDILETCRRACGGHAYSAYNSLGDIIGDWGVVTTGAGDNVVLLQQTANILVQRLANLLEKGVHPKLQFKSSTNYFLKAKTYLATKEWAVSDVSQALKDPSVIEEALNTILVKRLYSIIQSRKEGVENNDILLDTVRVAEMHGAAFLYSDAVRKYYDSATVDPALDKRVLPILQRMTLLWGLHVLHVYANQGFKEGFLRPEQAKAVEKLYMEQCKNLRNQVIGLTDAWGLPDFVIKAPIGKYNGDIYQAYFDTVLSAPNSTGVPPYHHKYIKPLTDHE